MEEDGVGFRGRDSLSSDPRRQDSDRDDDQDIDWSRDSERQMIRTIIMFENQGRPGMFSHQNDDQGEDQDDDQDNYQRSDQDDDQKDDEQIDQEC